MVETFIDKNSFTIPIWYRIMVNKHEAKVLYPNMMSLLELHVIIPSFIAEVECGFSVMKFALHTLGSMHAAQYTQYFNTNLSAWRLAC